MERDCEVFSDRGSTFSGSVRFSAVPGGSARYSTLELPSRGGGYTPSFNTLELFPDPDTVCREEGPPHLSQGVAPHRNCCCTCKCRVDHLKRVEVRSLTEEEVGEVGDSEPTLYRKWEEWSGDTSMHGVKYVFHGNRV